ncbi:PREDICTED: little elongation complex subunit 1 [Condylura cristata]|uniref:little elongation complex subunit 1 n=1 Tax=Condylura cristata TaxID=143302 RepID=UPI000642E19F|nr:PREDICTED: little elongation complex subunit 1 [Condylura cristata]
MLQKISSLQQCQEDLGSLKAELEEKKSSLKLYQDSHQEYARVKEQCLRSDAQKKKLEAKVKKLEETAVKQTQDFRQLRNEKKILEKEFRKTQEMLDEFSKQKDEKELRHIGTQISSDACGSIDRRKVKLLLKELWLCVNATHRLPGEGSRCVPEAPARERAGPHAPGEQAVRTPAEGCPHSPADVQTCLAELSMEIEGHFSACGDAEPETPRRHQPVPPRLPLSPRGAAEPQDLAIAGALRRIAESPFDLLPVIRSHIYVGNISRKPVMRDQEKDVVYEFSTTRKHLADPLLRSILAELKAPRASAEPGYTHALCRVYVGLCRQLGDLERARLLCYGLLKEGVPESEKLTLFIANMWQDVFDSQSVVNTAMQLVARRRADGEVLNCLRAFLSWEKVGTARPARDARVGLGHGPEVACEEPWALSARVSLVLTDPWGRAWRGVGTCPLAALEREDLRPAPAREALSAAAVHFTSVDGTVFWVLCFHP